MSQLLSCFICIRYILIASMVIVCQAEDETFGPVSLVANDISQLAKGASHLVQNLAPGQSKTILLDEAPDAVFDGDSKSSVRVVEETRPDGSVVTYEIEDELLEDEDQTATPADGAAQDVETTTETKQSGEEPDNQATKAPGESEKVEPKKSTTSEPKKDDNSEKEETIAVSPTTEPSQSDKTLTESDGQQENEPEITTETPVTTTETPTSGFLARGARLLNPLNLFARNNGPKEEPNQSAPEPDGNDPDPQPRESAQPQQPNIRVSGVGNKRKRLINNSETTLIEEKPSGIVIENSGNEDEETINSSKVRKEVKEKLGRSGDKSSSTPNKDSPSLASTPETDESEAQGREKETSDNSGDLTTPEPNKKVSNGGSDIKKHDDVDDDHDDKEDDDDGNDNGNNPDPSSKSESKSETGISNGSKNRPASEANNKPSAVTPNQVKVSSNDGQKPDELSYHQPQPGAQTIVAPSGQQQIIVQPGQPQHQVIVQPGQQGQAVVQPCQQQTVDPKHTVIIEEIKTTGDDSMDEDSEDLDDEEDGDDGRRGRWIRRRRRGRGRRRGRRG